MRAAVLAGVLALALTFAGAADPENAYVIDARILAIPAEASDVESIGVTGDAAEQRSPGSSREGESVVVSGLQEIRVDDITLTIGDDGTLLWNGEPDEPEGGRVEQLMSPRIRVLAGEPAIVQAGSRLQYLELLDDGTFELKVTETEEAPGLVFRCNAQASKDGGIDLDYAVDLVVLHGREEIPGVHLEVGRPILRRHRMESRVRLAPDRWTVIGTQFVEEASGERGDLLLVILRARAG